MRSGECGFRIAAIIGIVSAVAAPRLANATGRMQLRGAVHDVRLALAGARSSALRRGDYVAFVGDAKAGSVRVVSGGDTLFYRDLTARGATLSLTRDSITFAPTGLGWGAANTTIVVSRGTRAETLVVSRLGRVR